MNKKEAKQSIYRVEKNKNYVTMNRTALNDENLSWKAKGIIAYMLSMPDDWVFYVDELVNHARDGEDSLRAGLKELKDHRYLKRYPVKDNKGRILSWETIVYEVPFPENPDVAPDTKNPVLEIPDVGIPDVEIPTLLSIDSLPNTNEPKIDRFKEDFEKFWAIYPRTEGKKEAQTKFKLALKTHGLEKILEGTKRYAEKCRIERTAKQYIKHPKTFLHNECYLEEFEIYVPEPKPKANGNTRKAKVPSSVEATRKEQAATTEMPFSMSDAEWQEKEARAQELLRALGEIE